MPKFFRWLISKTSRLSRVFQGESSENPTQEPRNMSEKFCETMVVHSDELRRREAAEMKSSSEDVPSGPMELTVLQLLPDFDGNFDDDFDDMIPQDVVNYTLADISDMKKEVPTDDFADDILQDPCMLPALGICPSVVQRIRSDSIGKSSDFLKRRRENKEKAHEKEIEESDASDTSTLSEGSCVPVLLGRSSPRLSLSEEGFIILRNYRISPDTLGGGKLSEVRLAYGSDERDQYAVKIHSKMKLQNYNLLLRSSRNPLEEVYREVDILRRLHHPNVIKLVEVVDDYDDDNLYLIFEHLERELMEIPCDTPLSELAAKKYFRDIVNGLEYLHNNNIAHRDLKPENMLVGRDGTLKICDFGFCDEMTPDPTGVGEPTSPCLAGTPAFTPPECLSSFNKPVSGVALDMWSLGVTLYALVTGSVPFHGDNVFLLHKSIKKDEVAFPAQLPLSDELKDIIGRLLQKDPSERLRIKGIRQHPWLKVA
ncbi:hypothetical protein RvY_15373 [Ramazzottius varieornatus]|uniref:Protein kinase domain-containing protein n=1 Tax=Ramazzottius varieornatus TaxID=947166 RepID=A0A1D1VUP0_RAMVA|nr:hypothetical protein RvY_15373 [Ramazzottius varieornatus]